MNLLILKKVEITLKICFDILENQSVGNGKGGGL